MFVPVIPPNPPAAIVAPVTHLPHAPMLTHADAENATFEQRVTWVAQALGHHEMQQAWLLPSLKKVSRDYKIPYEGVDWFVHIPVTRPDESYGAATLWAAEHGFGPPCIVLPPLIGATATQYLPDAVLTRDDVREPVLRAHILQRLAAKHAARAVRKVVESVDTGTRAYSDDANYRIGQYAETKWATPERVQQLYERAEYLRDELEKTAEVEVLDSGDVHFDNLLYVRATGTLYFIDEHENNWYDPMYALARFAFTSRFAQQDLEVLLQEYVGGKEPPEYLGGLTFEGQLKRLRLFSAMMNTLYYAYHHTDQHDSKIASRNEIALRMQDDADYITNLPAVTGLPVP